VGGEGGLGWHRGSVECEEILIGIASRTAERDAAWESGRTGRTGGSEARLAVIVRAASD